MKLFKNIFLKLAEWFQPHYKAKFIEDVPEVYSERTVYIVGNQHDAWLITFQCPCGCKNVIQLNTLLDAKPRWKYEILSKNKINVSPSVWRTTGCKSHFFIRKGKIIWCR